MNFKKIFTLLIVTVLTLSLYACSSTTQTTPEKTESSTVVLIGEADGYGGSITANVTLDGDKIVSLELIGEKETPAIGGQALPKLQEAILNAGTIDGIDGISGATWTSTGVFDAINAALGVSTKDETNKEISNITASGLKHGIGIDSIGRLGPGKDDKDVNVYSFNEVIAYVITDSDDKIVDLDVDIVEIITPNHDAEDDNVLAGWPGSSYNKYSFTEGKVDGLRNETEETWSDITSWKTKREKGSSYKLNSGTWAGEMDIFEEFFRGKTANEIKEWVNTCCSDVNGRPLNGNSKDEKDIAKRSGLTDVQLKSIDAVSGATMSLTDSHGNILNAILRAINNSEPMNITTNISSIGLGANVIGRLGPGKDDKDMGVYSFNTSCAGVCYDSDGKIVSIITDILEVITPNHDAAYDNKFTGWPTQKYNADTTADGKVDEVFEQTEESFLDQVSKFVTKRELKSDYKLNSGTWIDEQKIFENAFTGKTTKEVLDWFNTSFSDINGRPLNGNSKDEKDIAKRNNLTDEQLQELDTISSATISLKDPHGDVIKAIEQADTYKKPTNITIQ